MSTLLKFLGIVFLFLVVLCLLVYFFFPHVASLKYVNPGRTPAMMTHLGPVTQTWMPIKRISKNLQRGVVEAEDGNFFAHGGIDWHELKASVEKNWKKKRYARGFSTITMQTAKNLYLTRQKTLTRKLMEILIALKMERELSKERILEIYLNIVEWGNGLYGAEAAARHYFKKPASDLTVGEASFLAAILPHPRKWGRWPPGPFVRRRMNVIAARMGGGPPKEAPEIPELPEETANGSADSAVEPDLEPETSATTP